MAEMIPFGNSAELACKKLDDEFAGMGTVGRKEGAVSSYVHNVLLDACRQSEAFSEVVLAFRRTLKDCLTAIMKGTGNAVSDIDVYRSAIQFYFPNSEIGCVTTIRITGDAPDASLIMKESPKEKEPEKDENGVEKKPEKETVKKPEKESRKKKTGKKVSEIQLTLF